jgi:hypothetical protein
MGTAPSDETDEDAVGNRGDDGNALNPRGMGVGLALGIGMGAAFGVATNDIGIGTAVGAGIGTAFGVAFSSRSEA